MKHFIDTEGPALRQAGVCPDVLEKVRSLHTGAWFKVGSLESVIVTKSGGRRGCKFGAVIFNVVYAVALRRVRAKLREAGVLLVVKITGDSAFWAPCAHAEPRAESRGGEEPHDKEIVEATYVDDQAVTLASPSPIRLLRAARLLMAEVITIFTDLGLTINFGPGKTEALVALRGKQALRARRGLEQPDGTLALDIPSTPGSPKLRIVQCYKHLGGIVYDDASVVPEAIARASSALNAFGPIATTVLGARSISARIRMLLAKSLVFSRLMYNVCTWSSVPTRALRELNAVYMRTIRRVAGEMRFSAQCRLTDLEVRKMVNEPSIDCCVAKARLNHLAAVLRAPSSSLRCLLAARGSRGEKLPWVDLVVQDMVALREFYPTKLAELGDPTAQWERWRAFICDHPHAWKTLVKGFVYHASVLDRACADQRHSECLPLHSCTVCADVGKHVAFPSQRALHSHLRAKHGHRNQIKRYIGADARCPACGLVFSTRLRAIAHATAKGRRKGCFESLVSGRFLPIEALAASRLDSVDRAERRAAYRAGLSAPRSRGRPSRKRPIGPPPAPPAKRLRAKTPHEEVWHRPSGF